MFTSPRFAYANFPLREVLWSKGCSLPWRFAAPLVLMSVADQARLGAQSGTSVVINEFRVRGPNGGNDEFIELFNPTAGSVDISGWKIRGSNVSGTIGDRLTLPPNTTLGPGCYYLATNAAALGIQRHSYRQPDIHDGHHRRRRPGADTRQQLDRRPGRAECRLRLRRGYPAHEPWQHDRVQSGSRIQPRGRRRRYQRQRCRLRSAHAE